MFRDASRYTIVNIYLFAVLEFYDPVNTVKAMSCESVNLPTHAFSRQAYSS